MGNEKELKGQEIPETQVEPTEELNSENLASQEETTKSDISEWDASEPVLDEPVVAKAEVSEGFVSEPVIAEPVIAASEPLDSKVEEKTSEQSAYADIPQNRSLENQDEIKTKWNWGAFALTMWFGIANRAYLGLLILLTLVPWVGWIFGIVWMIVFGFNGEKWALENRDNKYRDEEEFRKVMDGWNRAGFVAFIIGIVLFVIAILILIFVLVFAFNSYNNFDNGYRDFGNY
ncbi:hypothetical protein [Lactococcus lactis]|uniref:Type II secretory pathway, component PulD n=1 Tax=Lactococcus lactis subsp. lactis TaxID=1360 RepID=A0A0B8QKC7_LACLL|nr:hypothetical protein [Lactococcus lactis]KST88173.1 hypothetical protein ATCC19435_0465 [Lactococcus lactis subsp. lactis]MBU3885361.1 hypothetical protein [Lactococcus lactis]MCT3119689.1 hypothetical protein [Lactococcus lactis]MDX6023571.1 hypothetical protein [Lactococcus lactis subsp. lactis]PCS16058.1 hypothetical protein RU91_GL000684 [Lactococcus lactis subsp. lactis]